MRSRPSLLALACLICATTSAHAELVLNGAGGTLPQPLYNKWIEQYKKLHPDIAIDYQGVGSTAGINAITGQNVAFGASDAPLTQEQIKALPSKMLSLPTVAAPQVMIYNIPGVKSLTLDGPAIAGIYLGRIKKWNDPALLALNPAEKMPDWPVVVVHKSDGAGTTYFFTEYLCGISKEWEEKVGKGTTVQWPKGIGGPKGDGVAAVVKGTQGGIGYVEFAFAQKNKLEHAQLVNKEGQAVTASLKGVAAAIDASSGSIPDDLVISLANTQGKDSYPICGFSWLLVYEDMSYLKDRAKAKALIDFLAWCETDGQKMAEELGYAPLSKEMQEKVVAKLKGVSFEGEKLLK